MTLENQWHSSFMKVSLQASFLRLYSVRKVAGEKRVAAVQRQIVGRVIMWPTDCRRCRQDRINSEAESGCGGLVRLGNKERLKLV